MLSFLGKTPFFRLLLPVIIGNLIWSISPHFNSSYLFLFALFGLAVMIFSVFISKEKCYSMRWVFGSGLFLFLITLTLIQNHSYEVHSAHLFSEDYQEKYHVGTIINIPELKPNSVACEIKLSAPNYKNKVILYLEKSDDAISLGPGDEIVFKTKIEQFKNLGNPDDFDYTRYMKIKGFSGSGYVAENDWGKTGKNSNSITCMSQRLRSKSLSLYESFDLTDDAQAFISALTLGYKNDLTENLKDAFRVTGTAHVLAVSGLHVGIIYLVISILFSFIGNRGRPYFIRQCLVIVFLWAYAFIAGMSASIIRASIMLSINCVGNIFNRKGFTINTLFAAAFLILIFNPYSLYDISFQMSFGAVLSILYFHPKFESIYTPTNKIIKYIWNLSTISLSAQLGIFPIILYYFGTFPTYFLITNIFVIPLIVLIIYTVTPLIIFSTPIISKSLIIEYIQTILNWTVKTLIELTLQIVYFARNLPFSEIANINISLLQTIFLIGIIFLIPVWLLYKRPGILILNLSLIWTLLLTNTFNYKNTDQPKLVVFNNRDNSEISLFHKNRRHTIDIPENGLIPHKEISIFRLSDISGINSFSEGGIKLDILILSNNKNLHLDSILNVFNPSTIVLDSTFPSYISKTITTQSKQLGITVHDVTKDGAFSVLI